MNGQMDWGELFFSAAGRAPRSASWIAAVILLVLGATYDNFAPLPLQWITGWFVYPPLFYSGACVLSKRLHDRGRTGWWAALVLIALLAVWPAPGRVFGPLAFLFGVVIIWAAVELGAMPGELGANRFGPNPLRPPATA